MIDACTCALNFAPLQHTTPQNFLTSAFFWRRKFTDGLLLVGVQLPPPLPRGYWSYKSGVHSTEDSGRTETVPVTDVVLCRLMARSWLRDFSASIARVSASSNSCCNFLNLPRFTDADSCCKYARDSWKRQPRYYRFHSAPYVKQRGYV